MVRKVIIVSVHVRYFSFFSFFQFMSVRLHQVMSVYVGGTGHGARQQDRNKIRYMTGTRQEQNGHKIQLIEV